MKNKTDTLKQIQMRAATMASGNSSNNMSITPPKVIGPSPNAASLGMYGDVPVGHYTGIPNISIPLYEIVSGSIKVPISLSYHAGGIKVAQEASWVGLGWALNAGGVITRSIRGWDDFGGNPIGWKYADGIPPDKDNVMDVSQVGQNRKIIDYYLNKVDSEPDLFYYNLGSYSGKIVIQKGSDIPLILNQDPLKIEKFHGSCIVTVPDGNKYYFNTTEETTVYDCQVGGGPCNILREIQPYVFNSWYLDSIVSPQGDKVYFKYKTNSRIRNRQISGTKDLNYGISWRLYPTEYQGYPFSWTGEPSFNLSNIQITESSVEEVLLDEIIFSGGRVVFSTKSRKDLKGGGQCLEKITIYNVREDVVASYKFNTEYFPNNNEIDTDKIRLKLKNVEDINKKKYSFLYNDIQLPSKTSVSIDHWGLYNGYNNDVFNKYVAFPYIRLNNSWALGANREASLEKAQACILTQINYPTGGYSKFIYELNDYNDAEYEQKNYKINGGSIHSISNVATIEELNINIPVQLFLKISHGTPLSHILSCDSLANESKGEINCPKNIYTISKIHPNGTRTVVAKLDYMLQINEASHTLDPGRYEIETLSFDNSYSNIEYFYVEEVHQNRYYGGGIRVKKIEKYDGMQIQNISYDYTRKKDDGTYESTGKLMSSPKYDFSISTSQNNLIITPEMTFEPVLGSRGYVKLYSESITPLGSSNSGILVGYDQVTEIYESKEKNGKIIYYFKNMSDYGINDIPGIPRIAHLDNSQLLKKEYENNNNQVLKRELFNYIKKDSKEVKGVKVYPISTVTYEVGLSREPYQASLYTVRFYDNVSEWWHLISDTTITYDYSVSPARETKQVNTYEYANPTHKQLTKQLTSNSIGSSIEHTFKYPHDVSNTTLTNQWIINVPVEENLKNGASVQTKKTEYSSQGLPVKVSSNTGVNRAMEERLNIKYNKRGNIVQYTMDGAMPVTYLWGYNSQYPIAEIQNIPYDTVKTALGIDPDALAAKAEPSASDWTAINNLRNNTTILSEALVTTYTYKPLVGILTVTDPKGVVTNYNYDSFNRLENIKDLNSKLIESYKYHYTE